jgi:SAM-dependent methyltransferase
MPENNIWNEIFTHDGRVFEEPHNAIPGFASRVAMNDGKRILDLGCGSGRHIVYLAQRGFEVYGLDAAPQGLALTREWLEKEGLNAELCEQSMFAPFPYPDAFFDGVFSIQVIHHGLAAQVQGAASELQRVLKPGGLLLVTVPRGQSERSRQINSVEVEPHTYVPQEGFEKGLPHHIFLPEELPGLFAACDVIEQHDDGKNHQLILAVKRING